MQEKSLVRGFDFQESTKLYLEVCAQQPDERFGSCLSFNWYKRSKGRRCPGGWICAGAYEKGRKWWAGWQVGKKLSTRMVPQPDASGSGLSRQTLN